jgi:hypothetical protein
MRHNHYYLYIDDHGSRKPDHEPDHRDDGMNCFAFGGILVHKNDVDTVVSAHKSFCVDWEIDYPLHSSDIRGMREDFRWLQDSTKDAQRFHQELNQFLTNLPVVGFAAVVNRPGYNARYRDVYGTNRWKLCKTAYHILVERVAKYVESQDATFEVFFEQSGKKEDRTLKQYGRELKSNGHPFNPMTSAKYSPLEQNVFKQRMLGEPRERTKKCIFTQIADLYLYPMAKRRYDPAYRAWIELFEAEKVIDALLPTEQVEMLGIKYSCFDCVEVNPGSINPETSSG